VREIAEILSSDGKRVIKLHVRDDGFFCYEEEYEAFDEIAGRYWSSGYQSGLFANIELAEADIFATFPWLKCLQDSAGGVDQHIRP
jgi:hypothetical protein